MSELKLPFDLNDIVYTVDTNHLWGNLRLKVIEVRLGFVVVEHPTTKELGGFISTELKKSPPF